MSSGSRSGYARRISSWGNPSATIPTTVATGMRSPRMHGTPPICFASTAMRLNFIGGLCRRSFYPVRSVAAVQLDQLGVLEVAVHAADRDVQEARHAVEKAEAEDVELEKAHHRRHQDVEEAGAAPELVRDRKSTRLNSSHSQISYAVFCLKKKKITVKLSILLRRSTRRPQLLY